MDAIHLSKHVIGPTLDYLASAEPRLNSLAARRLVLGTAMVESDLRFLRQLSDGPALGLWQMEPPTHDDIWTHYLFYHPELGRHVEAMTARWPRGPHAMVGNLWYACAMARLHYWRSPKHLPKPGDVEGLATIWKRVYNTHLGAGTVEKALPFFTSAISIVTEDS